MRTKMGQIKTFAKTLGPRFQGRPPGPIKALHAMPSTAGAMKMVGDVFQRVHPYGIDVVLHLCDVEAESGKMSFFPVKMLPGNVAGEHRVEPLDPSLAGDPQAVARVNQFYQKATTMPEVRWSHHHQPEWLQDHLRIDADRVALSREAAYAEKFTNRFLLKDHLAPLLDLLGKPVREHRYDAIQYGNVTQGIVLPDGTERHLVGRSILAQVKRQLVLHRVMAADDPDLNDCAKRLLEKEFGVEKDSLWVIPEPNYHHDLMLVPLTYPDILVQDTDKTLEVLNKAIAAANAQVSKGAQAAEYVLERLYTLKEGTLHHAKYLKEQGYDSMEVTIAALKGYGFNPIQAPLVYGHLKVGLHPDIKGTTQGQTDHPRLLNSDCVNMANAHVHQQPDGKLVYLTMASSLPLLNRLAQEALGQVLPKGAAVELMSGPIGHKGFDGAPGLNYFEERLNAARGGFHCMFAEEMAPGRKLNGPVENLKPEPGV